MQLLEDVSGEDISDLACPIHLRPRVGWSFAEAGILDTAENSLRDACTRSAVITIADLPLCFLVLDARHWTSD